ncbi:Crp/Fnr family transcriptional regulator [Pseudonocardiaceae bacterium YIM PH 21723]|nr:Crp/Fnr family transcriptional regulator [Pseudonocardiaceae bacterium YIM PH 21723]
MEEVFVTDVVSPLWTLLSVADREVLRRTGTRHDHPAGTQIMREGDRSTSAMVLLAGRAKVLASSADGHQCILAVRRAGDLVGEMSAIDGLPRAASVIAIDRVRLLRIPAEQFNGVLATCPAIAHAVLRVVCGRLRAASERRAELVGSTAAQRLHVFLLDLAKQYGMPAGDGIAITLPLSQEEIAASISASRRAVVRALHSLRSDAVIATGRHQITILRPDALLG